MTTTPVVLGEYDEDQAWQMDDHSSFSCKGTPGPTLQPQGACLGARFLRIKNPGMDGTIPKRTDMIPNLAGTALRRHRTSPYLSPVTK